MPILFGANSFLGLVKAFIYGENINLHNNFFSYIVSSLLKDVIKMIYQKYQCILILRRMIMETKKSKIIILSGKAESGKNKVADIFKNIYEEKKIKTVIISYAFYLKEYAKKITTWNGEEETKPRTFLQQIGDYVKKIDNKFLINRLLQDIEVYKNYFDVIIVSDARFIEEINCIKEKYENVSVINIIGKENSLNNIEKNHITETALDNYNLYDFIIENKGSIEELEQNVKNIVEVIKW